MNFNNPCGEVMLDVSSELYAPMSQTERVAATNMLRAMVLNGMWDPKMGPEDRKEARRAWVDLLQKPGCTHWYSGSLQVARHCPCCVEGLSPGEIARWIKAMSS